MDTTVAKTHSNTAPKATNAPKAIKSTLVLKPLKKDQPISIFVIYGGDVVIDIDIGYIFH